MIFIPFVLGFIKSSTIPRVEPSNMVMLGDLGRCPDVLEKGSAPRACAIVDLQVDAAFGAGITGESTAIAPSCLFIEYLRTDWAEHRYVVLVRLATGAAYHHLGKDHRTAIGAVKLVVFHENSPAIASSRFGMDQLAAGRAGNFFDLRRFSLLGNEGNG